MIRIRYSEGEADIEGSSEDLQALALQITEFVAGDMRFELVVPCAQRKDPFPYQAHAPALRVGLGGRLNFFQIVSGDLVLTGNRSSLSNFAENLPFEAFTPADGVPYHIHYDHLTSLVAPASVEVTLTLQKAGR